MHEMPRTKRRRAAEHVSLGATMQLVSLLQGAIDDEARHKVMEAPFLTRVASDYAGWRFLAIHPQFPAITFDAALRKDDDGGAPHIVISEGRVSRGPVPIHVYTDLRHLAPYKCMVNGKAWKQEWFESVKDLCAERFKANARFWDWMLEKTKPADTDRYVSKLAQFRTAPDAAPTYTRRVRIVTTSLCVPLAHICDDLRYDEGHLVFIDDSERTGEENAAAVLKTLADDPDSKPGLPWLPSWTAPALQYISK